MGRLTEYDLQGNPMLCMEGCSWIELLRKLAHYEDLEKQLMESAEIDIDSMVGEFMHYYNLQKENRLIELPCAVGDELYRVTYPYRQLPKVTKYRVKNFRTVKKGQKLQIEVQADCVPAKNWMYFEDFCTTKEEAEAKLKELEGAKE